MAASDYTQLTVAQLQAWGTSAIAALQAANLAAEQAAGVGTITQDQMQQTLGDNNFHMNEITTLAPLLTAYAQQAFAAGAGN